MKEYIPYDSTDIKYIKAGKTNMCCCKLGYWLSLVGQVVTRKEHEDSVWGTDNALFINLGLGYIVFILRLYSQR